MPPRQVPQVGDVRVLLGEYGGQINPIPAPSSINYLDVVLNAGETWDCSPPAGHTVAWAFVYRGRARLDGEVIAGELVVLEEGNGAISIEAVEASRVLFGSATKHEHRLILGDYSVHTNPDSLVRGDPHSRERWPERPGTPPWQVGLSAARIVAAPARHFGRGLIFSAPAHNNSGSRTQPVVAAAARPRHAWIDRTTPRRASTETSRSRPRRCSR